MERCAAALWPSAISPKSETSEREIHQLNSELESRVAERTAQLKEANLELESFTYSVAHDLRAPLRHIAGFSGILMEECGPVLNAEAQRYLHRIQEGTRKMGQLVDELLTLARVGRQALSLQVAGLNSMVKEVIAMLQPEMEGRQVEWNISHLPFMECDPTLLKQVFQNLISNALKYSRPRSPAVIEIGQTDFDGASAIFVRDNGVGFNMKYADKLFGVFQRLHRSEDFEGTGVGLATVQRIIKKHQGRVWAEAELDKGATFYFTLGMQPESEKSHGTGSPIMTSDETDILLVEDSPADAELAIHALRREHLANNILIARDGEEALDFLFCRGPFAARSFERPPKLVLLDLKLPKVDGIEVLRQIKQDPRTRAIPVIVLTSSKEEQDLVRSYDLGANSYIQKPVDFEQFRQTVKTVGLYWMVINQRPGVREAQNPPRRDRSERNRRQCRPRAGEF